MAGRLEEEGTKPTPTNPEPEKALEQPLALLRSGDDTHRFVGLALLKSILDNQQSLREDPRVITRCWAAISAKFLDALLRTSEGESRSKQEAQSMVELAVAIIHAFVVLLPPECRESPKMLGRIPGLVGALLRSSSEAITQILQILLTFSSEAHGAQRLLGLDTEAISPLLELNLQQALVLEVFQRAFLIVSALDDVSQTPLCQTLHEIISALLNSFRDTECTQLFDFINHLLNNVPPWILYPATWLPSVAASIHTAILKSPNDTASDARMSAVVLSATLLRIYREEFSALLFKSSAPKKSSSDKKPVIYLSINLLLIDIRATIPSLLGMLNSTSFPNTCKRLAASYDIIVGFLGYLLKSLDDESDSQGVTDSLLPPSLMLRLRTDIAEAMSSTVEYMRDRFDAAVDRTNGIQASSKISEHSSQPTSQHLSLPWYSLDDCSPELHLVAAQVRTLGLWLREDENEKLRTEAVSIIDILLNLYSFISTDDIRSPIVIALEAIVTVPEGVKSFLEKHGWAILFEDLKSTLTSSTTAEEHSIRTIEIVRLLLAVVESDTADLFREEWMEVVSASVASSVSQPSTSVELELRIGAWQLAVELLDRAPVVVRRKYEKEARRMMEMANGLLKLERNEDGENAEGLREVVDGVLEVFPEFEK
ncbi:hypothetical protein MMC16_004031 [Acarospora aff. strigata]|nr:hypothetical protein [Acarospora aff. strigata]